jgi:hypothetical protein
LYIGLLLAVAIGVAAMWLITKSQEELSTEGLDEIVAITSVPSGARIDFRSGNSRTLLGVSVEDAEALVGRVGDRVPRRQYRRAPTPEPPKANAL